MSLSKVNLFSLDSMDGVTNFSGAPRTGKVASVQRRRSFLVARHALTLVFVALLFLWPFEMPIAGAIFTFVYPVLGAWYGVLLHASVLAVVSAAVICSGRLRWNEFAGDLRIYGVSSLVYLMIGAAALPITSAVVLNVRFAYQQMICGYLAPVLAVSALMTLPRSWQARSWTWFYLGWCAYLGLSFYRLEVSWGRAADLSPILADMTFPERLLLWRYSFGQDWNAYAQFIGNSNKTSNYLVMFLLLSPTLMSIDGRRIAGLRRLVLITFWIFGTVTLVFLFSRAALLLMPMVLIFVGAQVRGARRAITVILLVIGICALSIGVTEPRIFHYLLEAQLFDNSQANPLGTFVDRVQQWKNLLAFFNAHPAEAILGLGTSGYGTLFFNDSDSGTHNFVLDLWVESGVVGPLLFGLFVLFLAYQLAAFHMRPRTRVTACVALAMLLLLMTREHSVSYLYVTSLGGLCVTVISYVTMVGGRGLLPEHDVAARNRRVGRYEGACGIS